MDGWMDGRLGEKSIYLEVDALHPLFIRHLEVQDDIQVALLVWPLVDGHTFTLQDDGLLWFDNLPWGA